MTGDARETSFVEALDRLIDASEGEAPPTTLERVPSPVRPLAAALLGGPGAREGLLNLRKLLIAPGAADLLPLDEDAVAAVASVLSAGPGPGRLLASAPGRLAYLADPTLGRSWPRGELARELDTRLRGEPGAPRGEPGAPRGEPGAPRGERGAPRGEPGAPREDADVAEQIAAFRNDHYLRLAACEFGRVSTLEQVGHELATVADLCLDRAMAHAVDALARQSGGAPLTRAGRPCGLAAIGMGKYGAQELNFCSDIDLVFIYHTDQGSAGELSLHEFFSKVCQRVVALLDSEALEGSAFKVDLRLRPEGNQGPICNALASAERYYETWGGPYDRLAWLKARPAAGDRELGAQMIEILRPFVFPRSTQPAVVGELQGLYRRIGASLPAAEAGWNVKLGTGGIRAVEFFVQALQLLHAGKQPNLQAPATLRALDRLLFAGLISEQEHRQLAEAYELWRRLEHRLQLYDGRQTHLLPARGAIRRLVAAHMGYTDEAFTAELAARRREVQAIFDTLAAEPAGAEAAPELAALVGVELSDRRPEAETLLAEAGFAQPRRAVEQLEQLASKPWGPLGARSSSRTAHFGPALLAELARSPDPDAALHQLVALSLRFGPYQGLWELLHENRTTLRLLCNLFGSSDFLARMFIDHPELLDQLLMAGRAQPRRSLEELRAALAERLDPGAASGQADDPEARLNALRRFKNEEVLRVGLNDIAGGLRQEEAWDQLSDLAQAIVEQTYPVVLAEATRRYGTPRLPDGTPAVMVVFALGKLGSRELTYASDLDLIFIYSGAGRTDGPREVDSAELFSRLAQRLINALSMDLQEGRLYQVDTRLRPSGNQGTLVTSWQAFEAYHQGAAQLWERQALIKARPVAGDLGLGERVQRWVEGYVYTRGLDPRQLGRQMREHRGRMEKELAAENGAFYNFKLGRGGLLDIDFIVQYLQLCHGGREPRLRQRATLQALDALSAEGLLDADSAATLVQGYRFLRRIESRLRIVRDRSAERLPATAGGLEVMARRLGYRQRAQVTPGSQLLERYQEVTGSVRECYERIIGGTG